jgi:hypothetical protein
MKNETTNVLNLNISTKKIYHYLSTGCDERIFVNDQNQIKYWINLMEYENTVHRGSCTCGTLNDDNMVLMQELLEKNLTETHQYEALLAEQTSDLKALINYEGQDAFDVFYAPSGSDLVYLTTSFSEILHPNQPILNILSCPEELGSGTLLAVRGEFHAQFNQFEERIPQGEKVHPSYHIKVLSLSARGLDGKIINHQEYIKEQIKLHAGHSIIVSLVYGSKSGIEDNLELIDKIDQKDIIWMIDMCQFRHSKEIIHRLLNNNGCVMITGSKFYQAPPFCGALLVSKSFMKDLEQGDLSQLNKLNRVFSKYDLPESIREKVDLPARQNIGLRLRWACSLNEIKQFKKIPKAIAQGKIKAWNAFINLRLSESTFFELMPDQSITNNTIISFRVKAKGRYLNHGELKDLYKMIVCDGRLPSNKKVFIGQPVAYGQRSFLRLAIGSMNIRGFVANDEQAFKEDAEIIALIEQKIVEFENH